mmetsp:Transcript_18373/g.73715  ORF Transcript_18373/g.73715 Transcript_18373/m.73715 type:complete len:193 (-) Transcript_18373:1096-1674(-)
MDKVSTNVSESIKSISDKVSEIIAAEEAEIKEELLKTRKKASASSNSVVEEYLAKKQRTEDGLKRVRYSVQRILSSWQQRQIKRVEDISKGLVRTLGRARSRPRYVSRGELDNAVKELKESLSLDEIEDQVIRVIQDEIRKVLSVSENESTRSGTCVIANNTTFLALLRLMQRLALDKGLLAKRWVKKCLRE